MVILCWHVCHNRNRSQRERERQKWTCNGKDMFSTCFVFGLDSWDSWDTCTHRTEFRDLQLESGNYGPDSTFKECVYSMNLTVQLSNHRNTFSNWAALPSHTFRWNRDTEEIILCIRARNAGCCAWRIWIFRWMDLCTSTTAHAVCNSWTRNINVSCVASKVWWECTHLWNCLHSVLEDTMSRSASNGETDDQQSTHSFRQCILSTLTVFWTSKISTRRIDALTRHDVDKQYI